MKFQKKFMDRFVLNSIFMICVDIYVTNPSPAMNRVEQNESTRTCRALSINMARLD